MGIFDWLFGKKKEYPELEKKLKSGKITQEEYEKELRLLKTIKTSLDEDKRKKQRKRHERVKELEKKIKKTTLQTEDFKDPEVIEFLEHQKTKYENSRIKPSPRQKKKEWDEFVIKYKQEKKKTQKSNKETIVKQSKKEENKKNTIMEKEKLFKKFEDLSNLQFSEIEFIDFEGQTWRDSKYSSFIELFEDNKDFEYYFIVVDNTQGGYYQLKKTDLNKRSEKISQYDYDTDFGDLEENFDETNEVIEDVWCDVLIYKVNSDKFSSLLQNLITEFSNSDYDDDEFYEWLFDGEWISSYELPETLIEKLGLSSDVLEHVFEEGLEIDSVEKIKQNPYVINCGNTYGDRTQECFLGIKK